MAKFHLLLTCCALLLSLNWRRSCALPLAAPSADGAQCAALFRSLLLNITDLLTTMTTEERYKQLLTSNEVSIPSAETEQACAPAQNSSCVRQKDSAFSESDCRRSITKDLAYYDTAIQSYLESQLHRPDEEDALLRPTLTVVKELRKSCSTTANGEEDSTEEAADMWKNDSFTNRQKMCKMMRGFYVRAITINRAMGYISSGDHRK
ncbi:interleukin-12 subunit alpha [Kryptolebias marmoratus]|uniref:interleukin-12 subunit alpha n=1 Tax=Kryptolebias marmoratus TaxID=37003 RepID=UPI0007F92567|nr:interleukin-12 subunit alpha [Kryptolebias marmoratus]